jgi:hypothetical protein
MSTTATAEYERGCGIKGRKPVFFAYFAYKSCSLIYHHHHHHPRHKEKHEDKGSSLLMLYYF